MTQEMWMCERCQEIFYDDTLTKCPKCGAPRTAVGHAAPPTPAPPPAVSSTSQQATPSSAAYAGARPQLLPTIVQRDLGHTAYQIAGELVPVLIVTLSRMPIYFEHYVLLWKSPFVEIGIKPLQGVGKRLLSGMPVFVTQAQGYGDISFSRDGAGHVFPLHLQAGQEIDVREHQFLAATDNVAYNFVRVRGISNLLFGGTGFFVDRFTCMGGEGVVWVHGYGNVFEVTLAPGECIDVEPGGWVYKDPSVQMDSIGQPLATGFFASAASFTFNRFTGPGRVGIQSMYLHMETSD
jgi:uncharacterized protein (AIM24 family)